MAVKPISVARVKTGVEAISKKNQTGLGKRPKEQLWGTVRKALRLTCLEKVRFFKAFDIVGSNTSDLDPKRHLYKVATVALSVASSILQTVPSTVPSTAVARPFLKWAGGKGRLLSQYEPYFPTACATYYEPFVGGGAVFFHLSQRMQRAVLGDINPELVNVYRWVRDAPKALMAKLEHHKRHHSPDYYYHVRQQHQLPHALDRAARLIYLNKTCYNGLYRENSQGHFNVPVGRYKNPGICDPDLIRAASVVLQRTQIVELPFTDILQQPLTPQDFVYLDPPRARKSGASISWTRSRALFRPSVSCRARSSSAHMSSSRPAPASCNSRRRRGRSSGGCSKTMAA